MSYREQLHRQKNAFMAYPDHFIGPQSIGTIVDSRHRGLPGFHTSSELDLAALYGLAKICASVMHWGNVDYLNYLVESENVAAFDEACLIGDYPVVVGVDVSGYVDLGDLDYYRVSEGVMRAIHDMRGRLEEGETAEELFDAIQYSTEEIEPDYSFISDTAKEFYPDTVEGMLRIIIKTDEDIEVFASGWGDWDKRVKAVIGQYRYIPNNNVIEDDRIVSVHYVDPVWYKILQEGSPIISLLEECGWTVAMEDDLYMGWLKKLIHPKLVWERSAPDESKIEYHGTTYRNLCLALPWIKELIPEPPPPYVSGGRVYLR